MKTTRLTLPNNTNVTAKIGEVRIIRGDRSALLLPVTPEPIVRNDETIVYATESFSINMTSDISRRIACEDLRLALPEYLKLNDEMLLVAVLRNQFEGKIVQTYKSPQRNDPSKYNVRLAPALASAKDEDLLALIKSMCMKHDDLGLAGGAGNYPADITDPGF